MKIELRIMSKKNSETEQVGYIPNEHLLQRFYSCDKNMAEEKKKMTANAIIGNSTDTIKSGIPGETVLKPTVVFLHTPNNEEVLALYVGSEGEHAGKAFKKDNEGGKWCPCEEFELPSPRPSKVAEADS